MPEPLTPERLAELRQIANEATLTVGVEAGQVVRAVERFWDVFDPPMALRLVNEIDRLNRLLDEIHREQVEGPVVSRGA